MKLWPTRPRTGLPIHPGAGRTDARPCASARQRVRCALTVALLACAGTVNAQWLTQEIPLQPGWNAIQLNVEPPRGDCDSVFAGLPVQAVWMWSRRAGRMEFTTDPGEMLPRNPDWLWWVPESHPQVALRTLFTVHAGRSLLVRLAADAAPVTWRVRGTPRLQRPQWLPQAMNLTGLPVGPAGASFEEFFRASSSVGLTRADGGEIYQVGRTGQGVRLWEPARARIEPGVAYWIRSKDSTPFAGPLRVELDHGSLLEFPRGITSRRLRLTNDGRTAASVIVRARPSEAAPDGQAPVAGEVPLSYRETDWSQGPPRDVFQPLAPSVTRPLAVGESWTLELSVRRQELTAAPPGARWQSLIEVTDGVAVRQWVGVVVP